MCANSQGHGAKLWLPPRCHFSSADSCALGWPWQGQPFLTCEARNGHQPGVDCTRTHMHTHTGHEVRSHASVERLAGEALSVFSLVPVPLTPCPLVRQLYRNQGPHRPCLPICQEPAPGAAAVSWGGPCPSVPIGHPVGGLPQRGPFGAGVGGRQTVLKRPASVSKQKNWFCARRDSPCSRWVSAASPFMASLWLGMLCCLSGSQGPSQTSLPGNGLGGTPQPF